MTVRECVLDQQVVRAFGVDVNSRMRALFGYERLCVLQTVSRQLVCDAVTDAGVILSIMDSGKVSS